MNIKLLFILLWLGTYSLYAQKAQFTPAEQAEVDKYFLAPNVVVFEGDIISHENYIDSSGWYGLAKVRLTKSYSSNIGCGLYFVRTLVVSAITHDLVHGTTNHSGNRDIRPFAGKRLFSCTKISGNNLNLKRVFYLDQTGADQRLEIPSGRGGGRRLILNDINDMYAILPKPIICPSIE